ncbi:calcium lipid binding protein [Dorcoceras hygrometricum]|uniref:Calcium lipid binding protein n=1 Tax=Dorcoceras hygrometricum TaxID=472368 RepID=A0A2Z7C0B6_9LAMI|nr:calcium lipid binding protein [Dorcoceras hygrometricum]
MRAHGRAGRGAAARGGGVAVVLNFDDFNLKIETLDTIWQYVLIRSENLCSDTTVGMPRRIRITPPDEAAEEQNNGRIQLAVGQQPLWLRNHNSGLAHRIMVRASITDSACKNQLVVVSVQYGPFNPHIPIRSTTIGKSRVVIDPIAMHTSWRSNSDIASVTRVSMMFRFVRTNQYNQDLGLIHSTNGNHLESPNEGSSIDHQVTIYLHDPPVGQSQRGTQSGYQIESVIQAQDLHHHANPTARSIFRSYTSTQALNTKNRAQTTRNAHPKAQKKPLLNLLNETSNSRTSRAYGISQLVAPSFQTSINVKSKSQAVQRHQERQKQRLDAMEIGGGKSR